MGVKERKEREKLEMRGRILESAHKLFLDRGFDDISIRNIAEAIEYSPATIYLYFKDKNEIIHALHQDGFRLLNEHFRHLAAFPHPFERLIEMGKAYIRFATSHPQVYDLLFMRSEPMEHVIQCLHDEWKEGDRAFDTLKQTVVQCQQAGYFPGFESQSLAMMIWSSIHGICALRISGHMNHVKPARDQNLTLDEVMMSTFDVFNQALGHLKS
jgi:AcrR family transcriptional regulator